MQYIFSLIIQGGILNQSLIIQGGLLNQPTYFI